MMVFWQGTAFDLSQNEPVAELFEIGWFDLIALSTQALLAGWVGEKMLDSKRTNAI